MDETMNYIFKSLGNNETAIRNNRLQINHIFKHNKKVLLLVVAFGVYNYIYTSAVNDKVDKLKRELHDHI